MPPIIHPRYTRTPILPLPPDVAERIAAGEVIERPVSVVKELVENALDAGAREIRVEIRGGGLRLIRITDDGYGIPEDELERASARHTTSKISTVEDLGHLHTLGFRGEALASIAAVSELTILSQPIETESLPLTPSEPPLTLSKASIIQSKTPLTSSEAPVTPSKPPVIPSQTPVILSEAKDLAATFITLRGGEVTHRGKRARLHGTTATVRDLFYNVPARLKFMRGARTEAGHILQLMRRYAVGYPDVRFNLTIEEQTALQTSGTGDVATTLAELYQLPLAELLHPISANLAEQYALHGYIGNRALAQNSRQHIMLFINSRWVQSRPLYDALEVGYRGLLPKGKHPLLILYLDLPPEELDVNVHPAKTEVKLMREAEVTTALTQAVRSVLERSPALPTSTQFPGPELVYQRRLPGPRRRGLHVAESAEGYKAQEAPPGAAEILATLRPLAQLQQAVILAEAPDGSLYLIDQHRAHERVIYEHLRSKHIGNVTPSAAPAPLSPTPVTLSTAKGLTEPVGNVPPSPTPVTLSTAKGLEENEWSDSHLLLEPVIVELKRAQAELFEQRLPILRDLGLECERFGGRSFLIRSVPSGVGQEQLAGALPELAQIASEDSTDWEDHLLIGLACRSALRRGRDLGLDEQKSLITALASVSAPAVCPHGSPILLHYSRTFLIDKFDW